MFEKSSKASLESRSVRRTVALRGARQKVKRPHHQINLSRSSHQRAGADSVLERLLGAREFGSREFLGFSRRRPVGTGARFARSRV